MLAVPPDAPVTIPEPLPTVATAGFVLLHVPPVTVLLKVISNPWQTADGPVIAGGEGYTVTVVVAKHPDASI
jgi:hypothetical protein